MVLAIQITAETREGNFRLQRHEARFVAIIGIILAHAVLTFEHSANQHRAEGDDAGCSHLEFVNAIFSGLVEGLEA